MDYSEAEEIKEGNLSAVKVYGVRHTDVGKIFDCGQCFRFEPVADTQHAVEYAGAAFGRFVSFAQDGDTLTIYNSDISDFNNIWRGYLCLHEDYDKYLDGIREKSDNPALEKAIKDDGCEFSKKLVEAAKDKIRAASYRSEVYLIAAAALCRLAMHVCVDLSGSGVSVRLGFLSVTLLLDVFRIFDPFTAVMRHML